METAKHHHKSNNNTKHSLLSNLRVLQLKCVNVNLATNIIISLKLDQQSCYEGQCAVTALFKPLFFFFISVGAFLYRSLLDFLAKLNSQSDFWLQSFFFDDTSLNFEPYRNSDPNSSILTNYSHYCSPNIHS
jgi:hypothetical protein